MNQLPQLSRQLCHISEEMLKSWNEKIPLESLASQVECVRAAAKTISQGSMWELPNAAQILHCQGGILLEASKNPSFETFQSQIKEVGELTKALSNSTLAHMAKLTPTERGLHEILKNITHCLEKIQTNDLSEESREITNGLKGDLDLLQKQLLEQPLISCQAIATFLTQLTAAAHHLEENNPLRQWVETKVVPEIRSLNALGHSSIGNKIITDLKKKVHHDWELKYCEFSEDIANDLHRLKRMISSDSQLTFGKQHQLIEKIWAFEDSIVMFQRGMLAGDIPFDELTMALDGHISDPVLVNSQDLSQNITHQSAQLKICFEKLKDHVNTLHISDEISQFGNALISLSKDLQEGTLLAKDAQDLKGVEDYLDFCISAAAVMSFYPQLINKPLEELIRAVRIDLPKEDELAPHRHRPLFLENILKQLERDPECVEYSVMILISASIEKIGKTGSLSKNKQFLAACHFLARVEQLRKPSN